MQRTLMKELVSWKEKEDRKPLILWGARQVGKTWLLRKFGEEYFENTVYISFYNNTRIAGIFERDYDVFRILEALEIELHTQIRPQKTLIIFDEVQGAPKVVESLKYFCEEAKEYAVAAAGSLLGVALHEGISFPVGKVDELRLYPMSFREFLLAMDEERLAGYLSDYHLAQVNDFSEKYIELLKNYYVTGGMPECVNVFRTDRDLLRVRELQLSIIHQYEGDFGKYISANELPRIRQVWQSLPVQLAKENKKFFFGRIKKGARSKEYEMALQWLQDAGLVYMVYRVGKPGMPLKAYEELSAFKVFMLDVGLLGALSELDPGSIIRNDEIFSEFKGALTEQYVLQEMKTCTKLPLYYYASEKSTYELDFLTQKEGRIVPIEVKADKNMKGKSLKMFCEKFGTEKAVRFSLAGYIDQGWMENVPLWAVGSM